jgi:phospholipid transport system transporter-binding protein
MVIGNIPDLLTACERLLGGRDRLVFDLRGVEHADSAGLALLLELIDLGRANRVAVGFRRLPEALRRIARLSNVEELLDAGG